MTQAITKPGILERIFAPRSETTTLSRPAQWLIDALGGNPSSSGARVNPRTVMGIPAYFACVRNISEDVAKLPRAVYREQQPRGRSKERNHPAYRLVHDAPNDDMSSMTFHETMTAHALGSQRGIAEITRNGIGSPVAMYPLVPQDVTKEVNQDGDIRYRVDTPGFPTVYLSQNNVIDLHGLGYEGLTGYAMTCLARDALGGAIATQNFGNRWFGNGAQPSGIVEVPPNFAPKAMENLRQSFKERHEGEENKGRTMMLEQGVTWKAVSVDAKDAQMIEAMEWHVEDICRLFRMPPQKVGHLKRAQGWSTVEQFNTDYVVDCLMPWIVRWEQEYQRKLFRPAERDMYVKFDVRGLLRGDAATRANYYTTLFNIGALSDNDIRELEDMNPVDEGDTYYVQGALVPVDLLRKKMEAEIDATEKKANEPAAVPGTPAPANEPSPQDRAVMVMAIASKHEALLARELDALLKRESAKANKDDKWWTDHLDNVILAFSRVLSSLGTSLRPGNPPDQDMHAFARAEAQTHIQSSKTNPTDEHRAARDASGIIQRAVAEVLK